MHAIQGEPFARERNVQLDFFRGLALMIIFVNHMPGNPWLRYTPSRLGPSDAAEAFVFLSGFAAAIAYGGSFRRSGIAVGSAAVLLRCAQIYAAHVGLFFLMAAVYAAMMSIGVIDSGWQLDNLSYFFERTPDALLALLGLRYVPNFIDILPMYLVIMLWLPMFWALSRIHPVVAMAFSAAIYLSARGWGWELTADPGSGRSWNFNPFCWQFLFFTGFVFGSGWVPVPRSGGALIWVCAAFVAFCFLLENESAYRQLPWFAAFREDWASALDKSHLGLLRYAHFLALAYLTVQLSGRSARWLQTGVARQVVALGQQSLPVYLLGTCLSFVGGMLLYRVGAGLLVSAVVNVVGFGLMIVLARVLGWLGGKPWKRHAVTRTAALPSRFAVQGALAFGVLAIAVAPLILLQRQHEPVLELTGVEAESMTSSEDTAPLVEAGYHPAPEDVIDEVETL